MMIFIRSDALNPSSALPSPLMETTSQPPQTRARASRSGIRRQASLSSRLKHRAMCPPCCGLSSWLSAMARGRRSTPHTQSRVLSQSSVAAALAAEETQFGAQCTPQMVLTSSSVERPPCMCTRAIPTWQNLSSSGKPNSKVLMAPSGVLLGHTTVSSHTAPLHRRLSCGISEIISTSLRALA